MVRTRPDWREIHEELAPRQPSSLTAAELDRLGESLFWLDRPDESIAVLGLAFTAHVSSGDHLGAAMAAWQLFYDHALVGEAALASGWLERARRHADQVEGSVAAGFLAVADVLLARGDAVAACRRAGAAVARFQALGLPYDEALARTVRGAAAKVIDDHDTAHLEFAAARETFRRLGADPDARRVSALLGDGPVSLLSSRELDVLRFVARGSTNKEVAAELFISQHTVARHLSNIYTKLGVGSRSAATAFGYEHSLI